MLKRLIKKWYYKLFKKMKGDIRFYIDGKRVDLAKDPKFFYNWQLTDFDNPTITKNSYSKTISIEGTKNNNKIFGDIWKLDREQGYGGRSGVNFNPTYRVPFEIYVGGDLFERGYVKLQKVKIEDRKYTYEIGLFGTLGLFLYNLQTDWNTGEKRSLGDLTYYVEDTPLLQPSSDFEINKETVKEAWDNIDAYSSKWSIINFAPCQNGVNDKMETDKAVINFSGQTSYQESITKDTDTYTSYQGYALATLPRKLDEYEAGDLRSWAQRPVVRVKSVIEALCLPENNRGKFDEGFNVELDPEFFNFRNPYYEDAWMTLPMISTLNITTKGETETPYTANYIAHYSTGVDNMELVYALSQPVDKFGTTAELNFDLLTNVPNASAGTEYDYLYPSAVVSRSTVKWNNVYALQGFATTDALENTKPIDGTHVLWCQHNRTDKRSGQTIDYTYSMATSLGAKEVSKGLADYYQPRYATATADVVEGYFVRYNNTVYRWNSQLSLSIPLPIGATHFRIRLDRLCNRSRQIEGNMRAFLFARDIDTLDYWRNWLFNGTISHNNLISNRTFATKVGDVSNFYTGQEIKIKDLLNTSFTPADFLMDYCRMFGLYLRKDRYEDKIFIETRNTFFKRDEVTNIDKNIAYDKGVEIDPTVCEAKYYGMQNKFDESGTYKDYKNKYGKVYGEKLLNTGWEFDSETKQLINSNFKGAIQSRANGIYYFEPFTDGLRAFAFDGLTYVLYLNGDYTTEQTNEMTMGRQSILDTLDPYIPNTPYFDIDDRPDFSGEEKKPLDGSGVLLFHQGETDVTRARYYLTDDLNVMQKLCNKPCYIITGCEYDKSGAKIGTKIEYLPKFSRYWTSTNYIGSGSTRNNILFSMDYGSPRQLYLINFVNYETSNLYTQFYKNYFEDLYDVNTRKVMLYYKPDEILSYESLRKIYYFSNSLWRLNRIIDYNPVEKGLVKAEFVKINDIDALTNSIPSQELTLTVVLDRYEIDGNATTITGTVTTSDHGPWSIEGWDYDDSVSISPLSDTTDGTFTVTIPAYYNTIDRNITIVVSAGDLTASVTILQHPLVVSESVDITSTSPIPATATTIHYNLTSVPSATVDLKSGTTVLATQSKTGTTTGVFNITANTDATAKTYTLYAETPNGTNDTATVVQNASITPEPQTYTIIFDDISVDDDHSDLTGWTIPDGSITLLINGMPAMEIGVQGTQGNLHFTGSTQQQITTSTLGNIQQLNVDYSSMMWNTGLTPYISITTTFNGDFSVTVDNDNNLAGGDTTNIKNWANNSTIHITVVLTIRRR